MDYMFPRGDGIICGGSWEYDQSSTIPQAEVIARIVARQQAFFAAMKC